MYLGQRGRGKCLPVDLQFLQAFAQVLLQHRRDRLPVQRLCLSAEVVQRLRQDRWQEMLAQ